MKWIAVSEKTPPPDSPVLAFYRIGFRTVGRPEIPSRAFVPRIVRAIWVPRFTKPDEFYNFEPPFDTEYVEADDQFYWPEGWYECNEHEDTHWRVDEEVTHWMPLPEFPEDFE